VEINEEEKGGARKARKRRGKSYVPMKFL